MDECTLFRLEQSGLASLAKGDGKMKDSRA
jgi:hypothetical protein